MARGKLAVQQQKGLVVADEDNSEEEEQPPVYPMDYGFVRD